MKIIIRVVFGIIGLMIGTNAYSAQTENYKIGKIQIQGSSSNIAIYSQNGSWGVSGCPSAVEVIIADNASLFREMLSTALAAKFAEKEVRFLGTCDASDSSRFNAYLLIVY